MICTYIVFWKLFFIFTTFKNYQLTQGQGELLKMLDIFLESDDFCFLLKGYAGTGKTFVSTYLALHDVMNEDLYSSVTYIRSAVETRKILNLTLFLILFITLLHYVNV